MQISENINFFCIGLIYLNMRFRKSRFKFDDQNNWKVNNR